LRDGAVFQNAITRIIPWGGYRLPKSLDHCHHDCCATGLNAIAPRICQPPDDCRLAPHGSGGDEQVFGDEQQNPARRARN